jgi:hypothetical protein
MLAIYLAYVSIVNSALALTMVFMCLHKVIVRPQAPAIMTYTSGMYGAWIRSLLSITSRCILGWRQTHL